jgi:hypothetical protein
MSPLTGMTIVGGPLRGRVALVTGGGRGVMHAEGKLQTPAESAAVPVADVPGTDTGRIWNAATTTYTTLANPAPKP